MILFEKHGVEGKNYQVLFLSEKTFPPHFHRAVELVYAKKGDVSIFIDGVFYELKEEEMAVVFPNRIHEFTCVNQGETIIVLFAPELLEDFFLEYHHMLPDNPVLKVEKAVMERQALARQLSSVFWQKSFLYDIFARLSGEKTFVPIAEAKNTDVIYKMLLYVEANYESACTLKSAAAYLKYDYNYISKLFFRRMHMTYTEYLNRYRIAKSAYLLKNTEKRVQEISKECGYVNTETFYRNFQSIMQKKPKEYRREAEQSWNIH